MGIHKKLVILGDSIGQYLEKLKIKDEDELDSVYGKGLRLIIARKYITDRYWIDEIKVFRERGSDKWLGSILVDCFYKEVTTRGILEGKDPSVYEYDGSSLSDYEDSKRHMRKFQSVLFPLAEKIELAIINYVESLPK